VTATDPAKAIPALTKSLSLYRDTDFAYFLVELFLERARAYMAMGDKDKAENDLKSALEESERQRERVLDSSLRVSYFDTVQDLIREMVVFQIQERGRPDLGLEYMERGRGRVLLDALGTGPFTLKQGIRERAERSSKPMRVEELKQSLPRNVAVVEYMVTDEEVFLWVIQEKSLDFVSTKVRSDELQRLTDRYPRLAMENGTEAELRHVSSELYRHLLGPVLAIVSFPNTLIFVPDRFLSAIPFAALVDPNTGRYLIQDRIVGTAPSSTHYARATRIDQELARRTVTSSLVVANPSFDRALFSRLSDLPSGEASAEAIARLYPNSEVLTKEKATKSNFLERARRHSIVHFGGHTLINPELPALSRLVLAPADDSDSGVLYAYELYEQRLPETRLVVLASCSSAQQRSTSSEGSTGSLALAFLAAGVPLVLANLWDVEDDVATEFSISFHRQLREKGNAWKAVRASQLAFIDSGDGRLASPASWASFTLIGGGFLRNPQEILESRPSR
jgi:CHAT domain-containing protein